MKNKYLVELYVPSLDQIYDIYIPANRRIGNIVILINKALFEITNGEYKGSNTSNLFDRDTGNRFDPNQLVRESNIKNGSGIILI
jgi:hypothetical protein